MPISCPKNVQNLSARQTTFGDKTKSTFQNTNDLTTQDQTPNKMPMFGSLFKDAPAGTQSAAPKLYFSDLKEA